MCVVFFCFLCVEGPAEYWRTWCKLGQGLCSILGRKDKEAEEEEEELGQVGLE